MSFAQDRGITDREQILLWQHNWIRANGDLARGASEDDVIRIVERMRADRAWLGIPFNNEFHSKPNLGERILESRAFGYALVVGLTVLMAVAIVSAVA